MPALTTEELLCRRFRLGATFRLVPLEQLSPAELERLGGVRGDDLETVLWPELAAFSPKAVCAETSRLLSQLRAPGRLPDDVREDVDPNLIRRLVLDSVLEIEGDDGFLSGPASASLLMEEAPVARSLTASSRLSLAALEYAEALLLDDAPELSARLYFYNRRPITPRWVERLGTPERVAEWVGLGAGAKLRTRLERDWTEVPSPPDNLAWRHFRSGVDRGGVRFKLYVNPEPEHFQEALAASLDVFRACGFASFKLGKDLLGALRPDKLVAYARSREQIEAAGQRLTRELCGVPAQPVPFTADLDEEGLVSWGIDPPRAERVSLWQGTSWRRWVTDRLAVALVAARADGSPSPSTFAVRRVALEGIETTSWTPRDMDWSRGAT